MDSSFEIHLEKDCEYYNYLHKDECVICKGTGIIPSDFGDQLLKFLVKYSNVKIKPEWKKALCIKD